MCSSPQLPDCVYSDKPILVKPCSSTPNHSLYLSNLDDYDFLRFSVKLIFLFNKSVTTDRLKASLSRVLVDYYPFAGRLKVSPENDDKFVVDCNGEGVVFAEGYMDLTAQQFIQIFDKPNKSWWKLLCKLDAPTFLDIPPLVIQVTNLRCGAVILCIAVHHFLSDGMGTSQFMHAWAHLTRNPGMDLPITPVHFRHVFKSRNPPQVTFSHPTFTKSEPKKDGIPQKALNILQYLRSQAPLISVSLTFTAGHILHLKKQCEPLLKCTSFEALASHTWRCWVKALDLPPLATIKLLFSASVRKAFDSELPHGYYGNGFVLACAEATVKDVADANLHGTVKMVQNAKSSLTEEYVRSMIDYLEDKTVKTDLCSSFVITQVSKLGFEELDFGEGKPLQMGPLVSSIYCMFLPVIGDRDAVRVVLSMPESTVSNFKNYMMEHGGHNTYDENKNIN
ncbi:hypothetical protein M9H77_06157 [Catharanthus roseus]|uniref:Uncharacterized protein n=1 Tax=Catharanthus roseus TaxID=4058 RepID=A0ACC0BRM8_CATRO|nr:hypothetical protein M9H77_06157 [Catharanthus roseus]